MKIFQLLVIFIFCGNLTCFAQEIMNVDPNFDMEMAIYKEQKEIAKKSKEDCVAKNYQNYLNAKPEKEPQKP